MSFVTGRELGLSLCEVLGLDSSTVTEVTVTCGGKGLAKLTVSHLLNDDKADAITTVLKEYTLEPQA